MRSRELKKMANFFLILIGFFIIISNIVGFISYKKRKVYTLLLLQYWYWRLYLGQ